MQTTDSTLRKLSLCINKLLMEQNISSLFKTTDIYHK